MKNATVAGVVIALSVLLAPWRPAQADENAYFKYGPLSLTIPFKTADVVYLFNGLGEDAVSQNLIGGETTVLTLWDKVSGTVGVVTSVQGRGTPFVGADIAVGNALDKFLSLGPIRIGGFGGYDFNAEEAMAGVKASIQLWQ